MFACADCEYVAPTLPAARRHAKDAGPVSRPGGRVTTHRLDRYTPAATACPWCNAEAGEPCVTRAAHPTTGRAILLPVRDHEDRAALVVES